MPLHEGRHNTTITTDGAICKYDQHGQQIRVMSQFYRKICELNYLIPVPDPVKGIITNGLQYQGAKVLDVTPGYYQVPICMLDYSLLYPTIMIDNNLYYSMIVDTTMIARLQLVKDVDYIIIRGNEADAMTNHHFGCHTTDSYDTPRLQEYGQERAQR
ncbi:hypothetical protein BC936DRAFT_146762 [Jimgerdemannia flammicorona]|uniref:DNA-directed DNA polymerase n=1 Tax=Jimgerdemannia flammicorona TaxID=994334 RepID=A0A433DL97_9FUNG|nr:hypothetical protein BC936DRAFT_146762 [Jimgerdemannia flammicorona]